MTPDPILAAIADAVRTARDASGLTTDKFAASVGLPPTTVRHVLDGTRPNLSLATAERLLAALGKPWAWLDEIK